jgi:hypothetical protein
MNSFNDPAFIEWLSTLAISVGVSLIVAGALAAWSGRLLRLRPEHNLWVFIVGFAFLSSLSTVSMSEHGTRSDTFYVALIPLLVIFIYFLPSAAAINSRHLNFQSIFIVNLLFGWTIAGWIVAMFWAIRRPSEGEGATFKMTPFGPVPLNKTGDTGSTP